MAKFKKGDRVIATMDGYHHKKGDIGTINEDNNPTPYVKWDNEYIDATIEYELELIVEEVQLSYQIY